MKITTDSLILKNIAENQNCQEPIPTSFKIATVYHLINFSILKQQQGSKVKIGEDGGTRGCSFPIQALKTMIIYIYSKDVLYSPIVTVSEYIFLNKI